MKNLSITKKVKLGFLDKDDLINNIIKVRFSGKTMKEVAKECGFVSAKSLTCFAKTNKIDMAFKSVCETCHKSFNSMYPNAVSCSANCKKEYRKVQAQKNREINKITNYKQCSVCSETYEAKTVLSNFCSIRCKRIHDGNRRHIKKRVNGSYDETITLYEVYCKDEGICYLCGIDVNWDDKTPAYRTMVCGSDYPTIEHVIPLSEGGSHSWDNVRLACRECNVKKHTTPLEKYLAKNER